MEAAQGPTIDVVIPCFNAERYIGEAIRSVLAQGVDGVRVIVVDDGSSDASAAVARSLGAAVEVHSQTNAGIAAARNAGIARARAPWLAFLDADDVWTPGSLAVRLAEFDRAPATDIVFARLEQFHSPELSSAERERLPFEPGAADARFAGTLLARRESFLRAGLFDSALRVGEMIEWIARAQAVPLVIGQVDALVLRRRIHGSNTVLRRAAEGGTRASQAEYLPALKRALDHRRAAAGR